MRSWQFLRRWWIRNRWEWQLVISSLTRSFHQKSFISNWRMENGVDVVCKFVFLWGLTTFHLGSLTVSISLLSLPDILPSVESKNMTNVPGSFRESWGYSRIAGEFFATLENRRWSKQLGRLSEILSRCLAWKMGKWGCCHDRTKAERETEKETAKEAEKEAEKETEKETTCWTKRPHGTGHSRIGFGLNRNRLLHSFPCSLSLCLCSCIGAFGHFLSLSFSFSLFKIPSQSLPMLNYPAIQNSGLFNSPLLDTAGQRFFLGFLEYFAVVGRVLRTRPLRLCSLIFMEASAEFCLRGDLRSFSFLLGDWSLRILCDSLGIGLVSSSGPSLTASLNSFGNISWVIPCCSNRKNIGFEFNWLDWHSSELQWHHEASFEPGSSEVPPRFLRVFYDFSIPEFWMHSIRLMEFFHLTNQMMTAKLVSLQSSLFTFLDYIFSSLLIP